MFHLSLIYDSSERMARYCITLFKILIRSLLTSIMGLVDRIRRSMAVSCSFPATVAKYLMAYLADTVLPAPLSPDTIMDWFLPAN